MVLGRQGGTWRDPEFAETMRCAECGDVERKYYIVGNPLPSQTEFVELLIVLQARQMRDAIVVEVECLEIWTVVEATDLFDVVILQIKVTQIAHVCESLDLRNEVVVQVQSAA